MYEELAIPPPTGLSCFHFCFLSLPFESPPLVALFYRAVDWILEETFSHSSLSVPYHHVTDIDYADDIVTMDSSQAVLADILQRMENACSALALYISWENTKVQNIVVSPR